LSFFDNDGNPLSLPRTFVQTSTDTAPASSVNQTIAPGATLVIVTQEATSVTQVGSAH